MQTEIKGKENGAKEVSISTAMIEYIYNTAPDKMAGLTRLPLDQVNPCSMVKVFAMELRELCIQAKESQRMYGNNWLKYHPNDTVIDVDTDPRFKIPEEGEFVSIVEQWLIQYYLHRRSTTPDLLMGAIDLARTQEEAKQPEEQDEWKRVLEQ